MTLNTIIQKLFKPIAEDHLQINDFGFGDLYQHAATGKIKYPFMWVVFNGANYSNKTFDYSFSLVFADIDKVDNSRAIDIQSDMIQVAADVAGLLRNSDDDELEVINDFNLKPFAERFTDFCAGVVMDISVKTSQALDGCAIPLRSKLPE